MQAPPPATTLIADTPPLRFRLLWQTLGWGFVVLVIHLSLTSDPPDLRVPNAFNAGHVIAYFWLMFWFAQIYRARRARLITAAGLLALGIALELLQGMTGYRMFEYSDIALDALGIGIGLALSRTRLENMLYALERAVPAA